MDADGNNFNKQEEFKNNNIKLNNQYQKWNKKGKLDNFEYDNQFQIPQPFQNGNEIRKDNENNRKRAKKNDDFPSLFGDFDNDDIFLEENSQSDILSNNNNINEEQKKLPPSKPKRIRPSRAKGGASNGRRRAAPLEYNQENVNMLFQQNQELKVNSSLPVPVVKNGALSGSQLSGFESAMMKKMQQELEYYKAQSLSTQNQKRKQNRPGSNEEGGAFSTATPNTTASHSHEMPQKKPTSKSGRKQNTELDKVNYLTECNSTKAMSRQQGIPTQSKTSSNKTNSDNEEEDEHGNKYPNAQLSSDFSDSSDDMNNLQDTLQNDLFKKKDMFNNCYAMDDNNSNKHNRIYQDSQQSQSNEEFDNASTMAGGSIACQEDQKNFIVDNKKTYGLNEKQVLKKNAKKQLPMVRADGRVLEKADIDCQFEKVVESGKIIREFEPLRIVPFNADVIQPGFVIKEAELITDPEYFYNLMLPDEFFQQIVIWTNKKGRKAQEAHPMQKSLWDDTNLAEIKGFFGLSYIFGMVKKASISEHWTTNELTETPFSSSLLTFNRYMTIRKMLCFYDINEPYNLKKNCTFKIRFFPDSLIKNVTKVYVPNRNLALDESMIKFTGRHPLKQMVPRKPIRMGFKAYVLCECKSGLALDWFLDPQEIKTEEGRFYEKIVYKMIRKYSNKGYRVYMDRYYSSVRLFSKLSEMGIGACGAIQQARVQTMMTPEDFLNISHFKINTTVFFLGNVKGTKDNANVLLVAWTPTYNRCGLIMSNFHSFNTLEKDIWCRIQNDNKLSKKKFKFANVTEDQPQLIWDYNAYMGGVDHFDQLISKFLTNHSFLKKWYGRIIYYMSEFAMVNAFTLFRKVQRKQGTKEYTNHQYRTVVLEGLIRGLKKQKEQSQFKNKHVKSALDLLNVLSNACHLQILMRQENMLYKCSVCNSSTKLLKVCKTHNNQIVCDQCQSMHQLIQGQIQK